MMLKIMMIPIMKFQQSTPNTLFYTINIYQTCLFHQISLLNMQRFRGKAATVINIYFSFDYCVTDIRTHRKRKKKIA